jgi:hypothetical protein
MEGLWDTDSAYLSSYGSDEGLVQRPSFVQVYHGIGAGFAAQSSLIASDVSPFQLRMPALGIVNDSENRADAYEADVVNPPQRDFVLSLNVHCPKLAGSLREDREVRPILAWNEGTTSACYHESSKAFQQTRCFQFCHSRSTELYE